MADIKTVDDYLRSVPEQANPYLNTLREAIKRIAPKAEEVVSYGILGYRLLEGKRCFIYTSGYAQHVSIHPVPHTDDEEFNKAIEPYIAGKGTLRFELDRPLPLDLIEQVISLHLEKNSQA